MAEARTSATRPDRAAGPGGSDRQVPGSLATGGGPHGRRGARRGADAVFRYLSTGSGLLIVAAVVLIGVFLLIKAYPSLLADKVNFFTSPEFSTNDAADLRFGIRDLLVVTVLSSLFALLLAMPVAMGIALFLTHYAPPALARPFGYVVDLLAAVPSIIFGLWGILVLAPAIEPLQAFLNAHLGFVPLFARGNVSIAGGGTIFTAGTILAVMILPIITAVTREVFRQTPRTQIEGALALGATKWEMVRTTVLPYGRSGFVAGSMLGLGRALGETIAVFVILKTASTPAGLSLFDGGYTFATKIASAASEFSQPLPTGAYIAAGLTLFLLTFAVNAVARAIAGNKVNAG